MGGSSETLPSGRERAIETLIDMEPQGAMYRTARLLDEATSQTIHARPSLVTRAALVEQAYSLQRHEIKSEKQYDDCFGLTEAFLNSRISERGKMPSQPTDPAKLSRILHHHAKIVALKRPQTQIAGNLQAKRSPSPHFVTALRMAFSDEADGDNDHASNFRALIKSIMNHPVFHDDGGKGTTENIPRKKGERDDNDASQPPQGDDATALGSTFKTATTDEQETAASFSKGAHSLEVVVAKPFEMMVQPKQPKTESLLNGLLIAVLSILTAHPHSDEEDQPVQQSTQKIGKGAKMPADDVLTDPSITGQTDPSPLPALQIGALLSCIAIDDADTALDDFTANSNHVDGVANSGIYDDSFHIPANLLEYLGEAASTYEERLEIQKNRLMERLQNEKTKMKLSSPLTPALQLFSDALMTPQNSDANTAIATAVVPDEDQDDGAQVAHDALREGLESLASFANRDVIRGGGSDDDDDDDMDIAASAVSAALFEQIIAAATGNMGPSDDDDDDDDADSRRPVEWCWWVAEVDTGEQSGLVSVSAPPTVAAATLSPIIRAAPVGQC
mmetsp:Transcript_5454/g.16050  ORF Transcript_5454/g.16050 Transcript_5454/m.16050 type:complete len:561 (+) Transcript_5454:547-2229(+)